jgi:hypothetical protein
MDSYIDHHSWLVNSNLLTDEMKDNVATVAYLLLEEVKDAVTSIDFNDKKVVYNLLVPKQLYDNLMLLEKFNNGDKIGFFESFRLRKFIKVKKSNDETGMGYRLEDIANNFIRSYLNNEWSAEVKLFRENGDEKEDFWVRNLGDQQVN